jgi:hypothetical protein
MNWAQLSRVQRGELFVSLDQLFWEDWDPLGINDDDDSRDEYITFIPRIIKRLPLGVDEVFAGLNRIRTHSLQIKPDEVMDRKLARLCIEVWQRVTETDVVQ